MMFVKLWTDGATPGGGAVVYCPRLVGLESWGTKAGFDIGILLACC